MPGLILELSCQVRGEPMPNLTWLIDGINYNKAYEDIQMDSLFVIQLADTNNSLVNNELIMKIDDAQKQSKFECILNENVNDNLTIRKNFIEIIGMNFGIFCLFFQWMRFLITSLKYP